MARKARTWALVPAIAALVLAGASCSGGSEGDVNTTLRDFEISIDPSSTDAGDVTFAVTNEGPAMHEFVVVKTDLAEDALPTDENGDVTEEGTGMEVVDEIEDIAPDADESLTVSLDAGTYVLMCNLPGHYSRGMHTTLTVS
jgi:uncharacterized cupredoxin-like copper-binding protein